MSTTETIQDLFLLRHNAPLMVNANQWRNKCHFFQSLTWPDRGSNYRPSALGANPQLTSPPRRPN